MSEIDAVRKIQDFVDITETVDQHSAFLFNTFGKLYPSKTVEKVSLVTFMTIQIDYDDPQISGIQLRHNLAPNADCAHHE